MLQPTGIQHGGLRVHTAQSQTDTKAQRNVNYCLNVVGFSSLMEKVEDESVYYHFYQLLAPEPWSEETLETR